MKKYKVSIRPYLNTALKVKNGGRYPAYVRVLYKQQLERTPAPFPHMTEAEFRATNFSKLIAEWEPEVRRIGSSEGFVAYRRLKDKILQIQGKISDLQGKLSACELELKGYEKGI